MELRDVGSFFRRVTSPGGCWEVNLVLTRKAWSMETDLLSIQRARSSNADLSLVEGMASYSAVTSYINISQSLVYIALIGFSIAPQPDFLKNLSRTTWVRALSSWCGARKGGNETVLTCLVGFSWQLSWAISWVLGVLGILAYVAGNSYLKENWWFTIPTSFVDGWTLTVYRAPAQLVAVCCVWLWRVVEASSNYYHSGTSLTYFPFII